MNSIPIRQIDQTPAPERYARGWHCLGLSTTFTDEPSAITAFGTRIVVFRDSAGQAIVLEAICPHMGGDLTMGKVDGDVVRCPYHDWGWGAEGMCLDIPYAKKSLKMQGSKVGQLARRINYFLSGMIQKECPQVLMR